MCRATGIISFFLQIACVQEDLLRVSVCSSRRTVRAVGGVTTGNPIAVRFCRSKNSFRTGFLAAACAGRNSEHQISARLHFNCRFSFKVLVVLLYAGLAGEDPS